MFMFNKETYYIVFWRNGMVIEMHHAPFLFHRGIIVVRLYILMKISYMCGFKL